MTDRIAFGIPDEDTGSLKAESVSAATPLPTADAATTASANTISTVNSRAATTLAAGATFQGTVEDVSAYGRAGVSIHSDNASDGVLTFEVSHDGVIWSGPTRTWADTRFSTPKMWNIVEKYFRILYTNGTTEATNLSIQTQYSSNSSILLAHQLDEVLKNEDGAILVRDGTLFQLDAVREHITGQSAGAIFGYNGSVGSGAWEDICPGGVIEWLTTATVVEVLSTDSVDTSDGVGVRSVELHGLSATGEDQSEIIVMNGTSAVASSLNYIRVNLMHSETCGTYGGSHQGDITCRVLGGGATLAKMSGFEGSVNTSVQYGSGEAGNGFISVPLGKVMYITKLEAIEDITGTKTVNIALYEREDLLNTSAPFSPRRVLWEEDGVHTPVEKTYQTFLKIKPLTDVWFRAIGSTGASKIEVGLEYFLVDEDVNGR